MVAFVIFIAVDDGSDLAISEGVKSSNLVAWLRNQTPLELSRWANFHICRLTEGVWTVDDGPRSSAS